MKLILQEYLSMLKESDELEKIILNLLNAMSIEIVSSPQSGVRQHGVDIHGIKIDQETNRKTNLLITIKKGDITRSVWDNNEPQSIRSSLNEIIDVYIPQKMNEEYKNFPHKIILCYGGEMKQEVQDNWNGYTKTNENHQFDCWSGSRLSNLIEKYLTNEYIFLDDVKKNMQRTIVFLSSNNDYDLVHYKEMLTFFLDEKSWNEKKSLKKEKDAIKAISIISLCLSMINQYSKEANNLKHILNASELSILHTWSFIIKNNFQNNQKIMSQYNKLYLQYIDYSRGYIKKLSQHYETIDGICFQCKDSISSSIITFEQIGILSSLGLNIFLYAKSSKQKNLKNDCEMIANLLVNVISNNRVSGSPCIDGQAIDIFLAILFMTSTEKIDDIKIWIQNIISRLCHTYISLGKKYPISNNSIDDLVEFRISEQYSELDASTLIPMLAYWCAILDFEEEYKKIFKMVNKIPSQTTLQLWFPQKGIKKHFYTEYSAQRYGITYAPIQLPEKLSTLKNQIKELLEHCNNTEEFETKWSDAYLGLPYLVSRQFRTPIVPFLWLYCIK